MCLLIVAWLFRDFGSTQSFEVPTSLVLFSLTDRTCNTYSYQKFGFQNASNFDIWFGLYSTHPPGCSKNDNSSSRNDNCNCNFCASGTSFGAVVSEGLVILTSS